MAAQHLLGDGVPDERCRFWQPHEVVGEWIGTLTAVRLLQWQLRDLLDTIGRCYVELRFRAGHLNHVLFSQHEKPHFDDRQCDDLAQRVEPEVVIHQNTGDPRSVLGRRKPSEMRSDLSISTDSIHLLARCPNSFMKLVLLWV